MKEHHWAAQYFIEFSQASTQTQWNDAALRHIAYKGLAKCIKDDLLHFPWYKSLAELRNFILEIDSHYWERKEYDAIATPSKNTYNSNANCSSSHQTTSNNQQQSNDGSDNQKNWKKTKKSLNDNSTPQEKTSSLSSKLGKDGKLLPEKHQCRINQGLCLLCGVKGHMVKDCLKATTSGSSKACSTKTSDSTSALASELKK